jgi:hypothetical protein
MGWIPITAAEADSQEFFIEAMHVPAVSAREAVWLGSRPWIIAATLSAAALPVSSDV